MARKGKSSGSGEEVKYNIKFSAETTELLKKINDIAKSLEGMETHVAADVQRVLDVYVAEINKANAQTKIIAEQAQTRGAEKYVSLDVESDRKTKLYRESLPGADARSYVPRSVQLSGDGKQAFMIDLYQVFKQSGIEGMVKALPALAELLKDPNITLVGNNIAFDVQQMQQLGFNIKNAVVSLNTFHNVITSSNEQMLNLAQLADTYSDKWKGKIKKGAERSGNKLGADQEFLEPSTIAYGNKDVLSSVDIYGEMLKKLKENLTQYYKDAGKTDKEIEPLVETVSKKLINLTKEITARVAKRAVEVTKTMGNNPDNETIKKELNIPSVQTFIEAAIRSQMIKDAPLGKVNQEKTLLEASANVPDVAKKLSGGVSDTVLGTYTNKLFSDFITTITDFQQGIIDATEFMRRFSEMKQALPAGAMFNQIKAMTPATVTGQFTEMAAASLKVPSSTIIYDDSVKLIRARAEDALEGFKTLDAISEAVQQELIKSSAPGAPNDRFKAFHTEIEKLRTLAQGIQKVYGEFNTLVISGADFNDKRVMDKFLAIKRMGGEFDKQLSEVNEIKVVGSTTFPSLAKNIRRELRDRIDGMINDLERESPSFRKDIEKRAKVVINTAKTPGAYPVKSADTIIQEVSTSEIPIKDEKGIASPSRGAVMGRDIPKIQQQLIESITETFVHKALTAATDIDRYINNLSKKEGNLSAAHLSSIKSALTTVQKSMQYYLQQQAKVIADEKLDMPQLSDDAKGMMNAQMAMVVKKALYQFKEVLTLSASEMAESAFGKDIQKILDPTNLGKLAGTKNFDSTQFQADLLAHFMASFTAAAPTKQNVSAVLGKDVQYGSTRIAQMAKQPITADIAAENIERKQAEKVIDTSSPSKIAQNMLKELETREELSILLEKQEKALRAYSDSTIPNIEQLRAEAQADINKTKSKLVTIQNNLQDLGKSFKVGKIIEQYETGFKGLRNFGETTGLTGHAESDSRKTISTLARLYEQISIIKRGIKDAEKELAEAGASEAVIKLVRNSGFRAINSANERAGGLKAQFQNLKAKAEAEKDLTILLNDPNKAKITQLNRDKKVIMSQILEGKETPELAAALVAINTELDNYRDNLAISLKDVQALIKRYRTSRKTKDATAQQYLKDLLEQEQQLNTQLADPVKVEKQQKKTFIARTGTDLKATSMYYIDEATKQKPDQTALSQLEQHIAKQMYDIKIAANATPETEMTLQTKRKMMVDAEAAASSYLKAAMKNYTAGISQQSPEGQTLAKNVMAQYNILSQRTASPLASRLPINSQITEIQKALQSELVNLSSTGQTTEQINTALMDNNTAIGKLMSTYLEKLNLKHTVQNAQKMLMTGPFAAAKTKAQEGLRGSLDSIVSLQRAGQTNTPAYTKAMSDAKAYRKELTALNKIEKEVMGEHARKAQEKTKGFFSSMIRAATALGAAWYMVSRIQVAFERLVVPGIQFNKQIETTNVGFAAILMSMTKLNGQTLNWTQSMELATSLSKEVQTNALRFGLDAIELQKLVQGVVGAGLGSNMNLEQIIKLSTVAASAIKQIGLPDTQFIQEVRDMMQGGIQIQSSVLATQLGLTDAIVNQARASGTVFEMLMDRMQGFVAGQSAVFDTLEGKINITRDAFKMLSAQGVEPLINTAKPVLDYLLGQMITNLEAFRKGAAPEFNADFVQSMQENMRGLIKVIRDVVNILGALLKLVKMFGAISSVLPGTATTQLAAGLVYWFGISKAIKLCTTNIGAMREAWTIAGIAADAYRLKALSATVATTVGSVTPYNAVSGTAVTAPQLNYTPYNAATGAVGAVGGGLAARAVTTGGSIKAGLMAVLGGFATKAFIIPIVLAALATWGVSALLSRGKGSELPEEQRQEVKNVTAMRQKYDKPLPGEDATELGGLYADYKREIVLIDEKRTELLESYRVGNMSKKDLTEEFTKLYEKEIDMDIKREEAVQEALEKRLEALGASKIAPTIDIEQLKNEGDFYTPEVESGKITSIRAEIDDTVKRVSALLELKRKAADAAATLSGIEAKNATVKQQEIEAIRKAITEYHTNRIDLETSITKKYNELALQRLERLYSARGISTADYVAKKLAIELANIDADIAAARKKQGIIVNEMRLLLNNMVQAVGDAIATAQGKVNAHATKLGGLVNLTDKNVGQYRVGWSDAGGRYNPADDGIRGQIDSAMLLPMQRVLDYLSTNKHNATITSTYRAGDPRSHGVGAGFDFQLAEWFGDQPIDRSVVTTLTKALEKMGLAVFDETLDQYIEQGRHLHVMLPNWEKLKNMPKDNTQAQFDQDMKGYDATIGTAAVKRASTLMGANTAVSGMARIDAEIDTIRASLGINKGEISSTIANVISKEMGGTNKLILERLVALNTLGSNAMGITQVAGVLNAQGALEKYGTERYTRELDRIKVIEAAYYELVDKNIEDVIATLKFMETTDKASAKQILPSQYKALPMLSADDFARWAGEKNDKGQAFSKILTDLVTKIAPTAEGNTEAYNVLQTILEYIKLNRQQLQEGGKPAYDRFASFTNTALATGNATAAVASSTNYLAGLDKQVGVLLRSSYNMSIADFEKQLAAIMSSDATLGALKALEDAAAAALKAAGNDFSNANYIKLRDEIAKTKEQYHALDNAAREAYKAMTVDAQWKLAEANRAVKNSAGAPEGGFTQDNVQRQKDAQAKLAMLNSEIMLAQNKLAEEINKPSYDFVNIAKLSDSLANLKNTYAALNKEVSGFAMPAGIWINTAQATEKLAGMMGDSFMDIISGTKSVGEAFRNLAYNIIKYIQQIIIKQLAWQAASKVIGMFSGMFGGGDKACFVAGTQIDTPDGKRTIEAFGRGELAISFNDTMVTSIDTVSNTMKRTVVGYYQVEIGNHVIRVTHEHPIRGEHNWIKAGELQIGDAVYCREGLQFVTSTQYIPDEVEVYNLTIAGNHTYFANGVAVHNKLGASSFGAGGVSGLFAEGGPIKGPGTGTSDSIFARLSNGEFVIKAASVAKYGPDFLNKLNKGLVLPRTLPKFATGGLVTAGQIAPISTGGTYIPRVTTNTDSKDRAPQNGGTIINVVQNITTPDAGSFRQSQGQTIAEATRAMNRNIRRNG